jgi:hypothetical protein
VTNDDAINDLEAPLALQKMATTWPPADESDVCNGDHVVAIIKVIAETRTGSEII